MTAHEINDNVPYPMRNQKVVCVRTTTGIDRLVVILIVGRPVIEPIIGQVYTISEIDTVIYNGVEQTLLQLHEIVNKCPNCGGDHEWFPAEYFKPVKHSGMKVIDEAIKKIDNFKEQDDLVPTPA